MVLGTVPGDFFLKEDKTPTSQQVRRGVLEFEKKRTSLRIREVLIGNTDKDTGNIKLEIGLEPTTPSLRVKCSTD